MFKVPQLALPVAIVLAAPAFLSAQKDVIEWRDGTITRGAKVTAYDAKEIKYRAGGSNQRRAAHEVKDLRVDAWSELLGRAGDDPEQLVGEARAAFAKKPFVAQAAYIRAADIYGSQGKSSDMIAVLAEVDKNLPMSAYAPEYFRRKIQYYLARAKPQIKNAAAAAQSYGDASRTRNWSKAYELDAQLWEVRIKAAQPKASRETYISELKTVMGRAQGSADFVANTALAHLADAYRASKNYAEAKKAYKQLRGKKQIDANTRARLYLGLGYLAQEDAIKATKAEDIKKLHHLAYKRFLQVFITAKDGAAPELIAEGLYNAAKAAEQWNGLPTCKQMAGRLRGRLKLRKPWKHTSWAQKK